MSHSTLNHRTSSVMLSKPPLWLDLLHVLQTVNTVLVKKNNCVKAWQTLSTERLQAVCKIEITVSLKLSESHRFRKTATTEVGGFSRSSNASMRIKSMTMSKKFIDTTWAEAEGQRSASLNSFIKVAHNPINYIL